jgi:hypothetical protein
MLRLALPLSLAAVLVGGVTTGAGAAESTATVIIHTSLHEESCFGITMTFSRKDSAGRWTSGKFVTLKGAFEGTVTPSQVELPAGEWGIVGLACVGKKRSYGVGVANGPTMFDRNKPLIYKTPIAMFKVSAGEVVDLGSLRLREGVARQGDGSAKPGFIGVVAPIPEASLRMFAQQNPDLYRRRVKRPMVPSAKI